MLTALHELASPNRRNANGSSAKSLECANAAYYVLNRYATIYLTSHPNNFGDGILAVTAPRTSRAGTNPGSSTAPVRAMR